MALRNVIDGNRGTPRQNTPSTIGGYLKPRPPAPGYSGPPAKLPSSGTQYVPIAPDAPLRQGLGGPAPSTGPTAEDLFNQQQAKANAEGKARATRENQNTRDLVDQQFKLLSSFKGQRDTKFGNIQKQLQDAGKLLIENYGTALKGLRGMERDNEASEADASFSNVANASRERQSILEQAANLGAGESDMLRAQMQALRNFSSNQGEVNRSFFDTLRGINNSIGALNSDTATSRTNLWNDAEADREAAQANYANQTSEAWTQILNIENSNTNVDSDSSVAYNKKYTDAGGKAAQSAADSYSRKAAPDGWTDWSEKGQPQRRSLSSSRPGVVNLGGPMKRPEGATLRRWE